MPSSEEELLIATSALVADVLRRFGVAQIRATGGSMFPVLRSGDTLTIRSCTVDQVHSGDIVLVLDGERLYAHRLVRVGRSKVRPLPVAVAPCLVTRGDSHWTCDPPRPASSLLGRIVSITRNGRVQREPFLCSCAQRLWGLAASEWTRINARLRWMAGRCAYVTGWRKPNTRYA